jgi:membrane-associated phospholipid phosphatase
MAIRAKWALGCAAGCSALLALLWFAAFHVGFVERADQKVFAAFYNLTYPDYHHRVHTTAHFFVSLCDPTRFAFLALLPVVIALARRRPRDACAVVVLIGGAAVTTLVLKHVIPQPPVASLDGTPSPVPYPRFPSGHTTLAMSLVLALIFVTPARLRPVVAGLGAAFAAAVGYSLLTIGSHYPTDVFGGLLVAATWSLLMAAGLLEFERRRGTSPNPSRPISIREALTPPVVALLVIVAVAAVAVLAGPQSIVTYVREHHAFTAGVVVIALLSTALSTGVVLSVRRDVMS